MNAGRRLTEADIGVWGGGEGCWGAGEIPMGPVSPCRPSLSLNSGQRQGLGSWGPFLVEHSLLPLGLWLSTLNMCRHLG